MVTIGAASLKAQLQTHFHHTNNCFAGNFNTVLAMFSRCKKPDSPDRAESVFKRFIDFCNKGALSNKPDEYTYSLLLKTWYVVRNHKPMQRTLFCRLTLPKRYLRRITSGRSDNLEKAVDRLDWMRTLSNAGDDAALPDVVKVSTCCCGGGVIFSSSVVHGLTVKLCQRHSTPP